MADIKKLIPFIKRWEGKYVDDPADLGGATMMGVTLSTFRAYYGKDKTKDDLKHITEEQWERIFKVGYWDRWKADLIRHQSVANILVDWVWASGVYGIKIPQRILGVIEDGKVGNGTLTALNSKNPLELFNAIKEARIKFIDDICRKRPANLKFKRGWLNRINSLTYEG